MRQIIRTALAVVAAVQASAAWSEATAQSSGKPASAGGQGATIQACSVLTPAEFKQITGRTDLLGRGPEAADPSELPKGLSECEYMGITTSLADNMTHEKFESSRKSLVQSATKVELISGIGDEAFLYEGTGRSYRQLGIMLRVGERRLGFLDMVSPDSVDAVKPVLRALAKAAAPRLR
jgi:hypothetical protein